MIFNYLISHISAIALAIINDDYSHSINGVMGVNCMVYNLLSQSDTNDIMIVEKKVEKPFLNYFIKILFYL
jgi:hypothetical protein